MNGLTMASAGVLLLRFVSAAFFVVLTLLPLIMRAWRGETSHDRVLAARIKRETADLEAQTAIAVKQAEIRTATENLWAEQQLANIRLAVEAQHEINREHHRRRVAAAVGTWSGSIEAPAATTGPDDVYLPIAAEAEAVSRASSGARQPCRLRTVPDPRQTSSRAASVPHGAR